MSLFFNKKKNTSSVRKGYVPKTAQETIPYIRVFKNGIIESRPGFYTKMYFLKDINFSVVSEEQQIKLFSKYEEFLNSFTDDTFVQICVNVKNIGEDEVLNSILLSPKPDELNDFRDEYNNILKENIKQGRNNLVSEKYLIVGIPCENAEIAKSSFIRIDAEVNAKLKPIIVESTEPATLNQRIKILHDICNIGNEINFIDEIDINEIAKQGLSTKDIVAPSGFQFNSDHFILGDKFARIMYLKTLPSSLSTELLAEISNLPFNVTASVFLEPIEQGEAGKLIKNKLLNINADIINAQKKASQGGYSAELISHDLLEAKETVENLLDDISHRDQKLFQTTVSVIVYGDTLEELKAHTDSLMSLGNRFLLRFDKLLYQQEFGFRSAIPLGLNDITVKRVLTSETAALFIPFSSKELMQKGGMYYGINAVTKNLIVLDRFKCKNQNGVILGTPGSGKSFSAKREMFNVLLNTSDDVYVIDPEGEYTKLANALGPSVAEIVNLCPGKEIYINPFDMDVNYAKDDEGGNDPIPLKADFINVLCETMMGGRMSLSPNQKTIINRCVNSIYRGYMAHIRNNPDISCDTSMSPTLDNFYEELMGQPESEARNIALALELYCKGSFDTFAHRTNVDINKRFVVFNIKNLGDAMKELGLQVCLNHIWNKIISNKAKKIRTWFYIDEFYLLLQTESSTKFLQQLWKRARKWDGVPTGITQNVGDLLSSEEATTIINNCDFVYMLNQSPIDRSMLAQLYNISDDQLSYITDAPAGQGLIYNGSTIIPFYDKFPTDTKMFKVMNTKSSLDVA